MSSRIKAAKIFQGLYLLNPYQGSAPWDRPPAVYNIRKLNLCLKTDTKETTWINACFGYQNKVFWIFWKILSLVFLGNNLEWKLILLLIFHLQSHICQNSGSYVMDQTAVSQSNYRILYFWHADKHGSLLWVCATRHGQCTQNKEFAYPCNISRKKGWGGGDVNFFPANEHKSFLQVDSILWVCLARHAESTQNNKFTISL